jgi:hypothetical protein
MGYLWGFNGIVNGIVNGIRKVTKNEDYLQQTWGFKCDE